MKPVFATMIIALLIASLALAVQPVENAQSSILAAITVTPSPRAATPPPPPPPPDDPKDPDLPKTGLVAPEFLLSPWIEPAMEGFVLPPSALQPNRMENGFIYIDSSPMVKLEIPALGIRTSIIELDRSTTGWDVSQLDKSAGWLSNTSWPGYGGNTVLAGHLNLDGFRGGPFLFINTLKPGDLVHVYTEENQITYKVKKQKLVNASDQSIYSSTDSQKLTLLTCANWNPNSRQYEKRLLVEAEFVGIKGLDFTRRVFKQRLYPYPE